MTVAELKKRMDAREFWKWAVFDKIEREDEEAWLEEQKRKHTSGTTD